MQCIIGHDFSTFHGARFAKHGKRLQVQQLRTTNTWYNTPFPVRLLSTHPLVPFDKETWTMPPSKTHRIPDKNSPPDGFEKLRPTLDKFQAKLIGAEHTAADPSRPKHELKWEIHRIRHQQSRYIYSLYHQRHLISADLYRWLVRHRYVDGQLVAKWRKQGYEHLCCLECIGETVCVCRVPKAVRTTDPDFRCVSCGCRGCASTD